MFFTYSGTIIILVFFLLVGCSGPRIVQQENYRSSDVSADSLLAHLPMYPNSLTTLRGHARAIVSEPGNTERVRLRFSGNRTKSLVSVKNSLGIEGGELLADRDTLLIYNKVDNFARKIPVRGARLDRINRIAALNIVDMMNYSVAAGQVQSVLENRDFYLLLTRSGTKIYVNRESYVIERVSEPAESSLPYSKIMYEAYHSLKEFKLPRRITIFGPEGESKIDLQIISLELNPALDSLAIELPDNIPVYRQ